MMNWPDAEVSISRTPVFAADPLNEFPTQYCLPAAAVGRVYVTAVPAVAFWLNVYPLAFVLPKVADDPVVTVTGAVPSTIPVATRVVALIVPNVCVPVNVWAASVLAMVALVAGKVSVTPSVPARVSELFTVSTLALAIVSVPVVVVIVSPSMVPGNTRPEGRDSVHVPLEVIVHVPLAVI